ncbi:mRNA cap guanine-N7 methyltransferase isoform X2 [Anoplophora glabripennis]|uniref:mRNA cap guanine-N7 methyltransferase isoform X2 n=1 Tax=Anoplophora glabripennis TaxID=217634 RepID=UPI000875A80F|nr:mRNA cap guanine-N7 methyltransferase isoform X2 [Anoplophora glabripennis]
MDEITENGEVETLILAAANADSGQYNSETEEVEDRDELETSKCSINIDEDINKTINYRKRKYDDEAETPKKLKTADGYAEVVATHYNLLEEKGLDERSKSRIVYLRNFHNWIKSMLINEYLTKIKDKKKHNAPIRIHDMCCGKGGDLLKWRKGGITHLICSDIASVSLEQCKARYNDMKNRGNRDRGSGNIYSIEYILGDCTKMRLREKFSDPSMKLDLVSCQFAFHYSFESLPQAECMLRNASECLQPGGYFIGTIPDAYDLIARAKRYETNTYGNNVYQVALDFDLNKPELFGAKCDFHLDGVVDCPEFLVHFPTFIKLAKKYGLKLINKEKFYEFFERMKLEGRQLLNNMAGLETYPPNATSSLVGTDSNDYTHASEFIKKEGKDNLQVGTLSKSEWEASCKLTSYVYNFCV